MNKTLIPVLLTVCLLPATVLLPALEENESQTNFFFNTEEKVVPRYCSTIIIARSKDKALPFLIVGRPVDGELVIVQPDDDDMLSLTQKDDMAAGLLGYGDLQGEFSVDFTAYSGGYPEAHQLGIEYYAERPAWTIEVDEVTDFSYTKDKKKKKKGKEAGGDGVEYTGVINGHLKVGSGKQAKIRLAETAKIVMIEPSSKLRLQEAGPAQMEYTNSTISFRFSKTVKGKDLGWDVGQVELEIFFVGFADLRKGTNKLFKENLPKVRMD